MDVDEAYVHAGERKRMGSSQDANKSLSYKIGEVCNGERKRWPRRDELWYARLGAVLMKQMYIGRLKSSIVQLLGTLWKLTNEQVVTKLWLVRQVNLSTNKTMFGLKIVFFINIFKRYL